MYKKIILLLLISAISTKTELDSTIIDFDVKQPFDENNLVFTFTNSALDQKFFLMQIDSDIYSVNYEYQCGSTGKSSSSAKNHLFIIKANSGDCTINISYAVKELKSKGTIWVHPFENKIIFNLEKEGKFSLSNYLEFNEQFPSLFFSVSNLTSDTEVNFIYGLNLINKGDKYFTLKNPIRVCEGNDCKENVTNYKFLNETDYTIEIKTEEVTVKNKKYYFMNSFNYYRRSNGGNYILANPLIYLILLMLFI